MKVLLLGVGLQGKAALHDLSRSPLVKKIVAADIEAQAAEAYVRRRGYPAVEVVPLDAAEEKEIARLIEATQADLVLCMLPAHLSGPVAQACLEVGRPFVNTSYRTWVDHLDRPAREKKVTILPEMGFDPGIDLVVGKLAVAELDQVVGFHSYGAGIPDQDCLDNPLNYKITWTLDGVLKAYKRPARMLRDGVVVEIDGRELFREENIHLIDVPGVGELEAYPNGDATRFIETFGLGEGLREMGRFAARRPGHAAFWRIMVELGFLDDEPLEVKPGCQISPHQFLVKHLTPRLQFREGEKDLSVLRVQVWGLKEGRRIRVTYEMVDRRDLETGFFSMNRVVGYTASIAVQMILSGEINRPGVLSPVKDVPAGRLLEELEARGIVITRRVEEMA